MKHGAGYYIFAVSLLLINATFDWPLIQLAKQHIVGHIDMGIVLNWSSCSQFGFFPWQNLTPNCEGYIYGNAFLNIGHLLGLNSSHAQIISLGLALLVSLVITACIVNSNIRQTYKILLVVAIALSPATNLLFERGNLDMLMFLLVALGAFLYSKQRHIAGLLAICLATLIKFYTLPLLILCVLLMPNRFWRVVSSLSFILVTLDVLIEVNRIKFFPGFGKASESFPSIDEDQFGISHWGYYPLPFGRELGDVKIWYVLGLGLIILILYALNRSNLLVGFNPLFETDRKFKLRSESIFFVFMAVTYLACYFTGSNYDYRLIFLLGAAVTLHTILPTTPWKQSFSYSIFFLPLVLRHLAITPFFTVVPWPWSLMRFGLEMLSDLFLATVTALLVHYFAGETLARARNHKGMNKIISKFKWKIRR